MRTAMGFAMGLLVGAGIAAGGYALAQGKARQAPANLGVVRYEVSEDGVVCYWPALGGKVTPEWMACVKVR